VHHSLHEIQFPSSILSQYNNPQTIEGTCPLGLDREAIQINNMGYNNRLYLIIYTYIIYTVAFNVIKLNSQHK